MKIQSEKFSSLLNKIAKEQSINSLKKGTYNKVLKGKVINVLNPVGRFNLEYEIDCEFNVSEDMPVNVDMCKINRVHLLNVDRLENIVVENIYELIPSFFSFLFPCDMFGSFEFYGEKMAEIKAEKVNEMIIETMTK